MGKIKFDVVGGVEAEAASGGSYSGPLPPPGAYKAVLKRLELVKNKNGQPMLKYLLELKDKATAPNGKYNGYGVWGNLNVTDQGKGYVNAFLDALSDGTEAGITKIRKAFWTGGLITEDDAGGHVIKIGTLKVSSPKAELPINFSGKKGSWGGQDKLEVAKFLLQATKQDDEDVEEVEEWEDSDEDVTDADDEDGELF